MRRRSRDITVFNLSMMDVITGAMGAFLIVMVVLARYYESDPGNKENVEQLKAELSQATDRLREIDLEMQKEGPQSGNIKRSLDRAKRNLKDAERDAENLREQLDQAEQELKRKDKTVKELKKRRAFSIASYWTCKNVDVDIFVWDSQRAVKDNSPTPSFNPAKKQRERWNTDFHADWPKHNTDLWLVGSAVAGTEFKVYVKLAKPSAVRRPCKVLTSVITSTNSSIFDRTLSRSTPWLYITRVRQVTGDNGQEFRIEKLTKAEQEAEKRAIAQRGLGG